MRLVTILSLSLLSLSFSSSVFFGTFKFVIKLLNVDFDRDYKKLCYNENLVLTGFAIKELHCMLNKIKIIYEFTFGKI